MIPGWLTKCEMIALERRLAPTVYGAESK